MLRCPPSHRIKNPLDLIPKAEEASRRQETNLWAPCHSWALHGAPLCLIIIRHVRSVLYEISKPIIKKETLEPKPIEKHITAHHQKLICTIDLDRVKSMACRYYKYTIVQICTLKKGFFCGWAWLTLITFHCLSNY